MKKQTAFYKKNESATIDIGWPAWIYVINHPRLGNGTIRTSPVISYDPETGKFETKNTIYHLDLQDD